jgi:hypothetical protein
VLIDRLPVEVRQQLRDASALSVEDFLQQVAALANPKGPPMAVRRKLPDERRSMTHKFQIAGHDGYIHVGMYDDGSPGEIFVRMAKEGSTISGLMDSLRDGGVAGATARGAAQAAGRQVQSDALRAVGLDRQPGHSARQRRSWTTCSAGWRRSSCPIRYQGEQLEMELAATPTSAPVKATRRRSMPHRHCELEQPVRVCAASGLARRDGCPDLPRVRHDHGALRRLPQVPQLRRHLGLFLRTPSKTVMRNLGCKEEDRSVRKYVRTDDAADKVRNRFC